MASIDTIASMMGVMKAVYPHYLKDADIKPTATAWAGLFQQVEDADFVAAFKVALGKCKFPPTPADVMFELKQSFTRSINPSTEWEVLVKTCEKVNDLRSMFGYTYVPEGETLSQGEQARHDVRKAYYELPKCLQDYVGSSGALLQYAIEMQRMDGTGLQIRRRDYEKWRRDFVSESDLPALLESPDAYKLAELES